MDSNRILGTFKFSSTEHIRQFAQGLLFMNTLQYFGSIEKNPARSDPHEGASRIVQGRGALLQIRTAGKWEPVGTILGPVHQLSDTNLRANVFCMYALRTSAAHALVDMRAREFGEAFAVLIDHDEFMRRVKIAAVNCGHQLHYDLVEYVD